MALPLFGTVLSLNVTTNNSEIQLALGAITYVHLTASTSLNIIGLLATGGNVDGMVVTFVNESSNGIAFLHDSSLESTLGNRFLNYVLGNKLVNQNTSVIYRYNGTGSRWQHLGSCF